MRRRAHRFGYTRWAMINLVREHRAGKLGLFAAPRRPGPVPGTAPAKDRARGRVIELRRQGLSSYEISRRLAAEDTPLNRTSVAEILAGVGRLLQHPEPGASISPATPGRNDLAGHHGDRLRYLAGPAGQHPGGAAAGRPGPACCWTLPALAAAAGYPGTRVIPALSWLLSLLALKLTRTRRVSHVDDLLADPPPPCSPGSRCLPNRP